MRISVDSECAITNQHEAEQKNGVNKLVYRYELLSIKLIPIIIVGFMVLNTLLSFFGIDCEIFSHLIGVSVLTVILMYISSVVFKFCAYHRIFIHYIAIMLLLDIVDWYTDVLRTTIDINILLLSLVAAGIIIFLAIILKIKRI